MQENKKFFSGEDPFFDGKRSFLEAEPIIQKSEYVGSFYLLEQIQEGVEVKENQIIGYIEIDTETGKKETKTVFAKAAGVITKILPSENGASVECNQELFTITPVPEKSIFKILSS